MPTFNCMNEGALSRQAPLLYLKPVQTGFPADSDARLVVLPLFMRTDSPSGRVAVKLLLNLYCSRLCVQSLYTSHCHMRMQKSCVLPAVEHACPSC